MTPGEKKVKVREIFTRVSAAKRKADEQLYKLMYCPTATAEDFEQLHQICLNIAKMLTEIVTKLRKAYPMAAYPYIDTWNKPEYDKYAK